VLPYDSPLASDKNSALIAKALNFQKWKFPSTAGDDRECVPGSSGWWRHRVLFPKRKDRHAFPLLSVLICTLLLGAAVLVLWVILGASLVALPSWNSHFDEAITKFLFSPNSKLLASGNLRGEIHIWDVATGAVVQRIKVSSAPAAPLAFSPDSSVLLTKSDDHYLRAWQPLSGKLVGAYSRPQWIVLAGCAKEDGQWSVAALRPDKTLILGDPISGIVRSELRKLDEFGKAVFATDCSEIVALDKSGKVNVWTSEGAPQWSTTLQGISILNQAALSRDGRYLAVSTNEAIQIWDV
jgi:WD40 repeat protein